MAPKKPLKRPPATVEQLSQKIIYLGENIRSHAASAKQNSKKPSPPRIGKFVEPDIPKPPPIVSTDLADNPYAQEIFMCKTNVREIAMDVAERDGYAKTEKILGPFRKKLYRGYASDPKSRIRPPLDRLRFESPYYEYRFFLALNKPLHSEEEYQDYREQLEAAGVAESWVPMRPNNLLLEFEDTVLRKLKAKFNRWDHKLGKYDVYIMSLVSKHHCAPPKIVAQQSNEDDPLLAKLLKRSNAKDMLSEAQIRAMFQRIKRILLEPEKVGFQWLIFEDDELNKQFHLGSYRSDAIAEIELVDTVPPHDSDASSNRPGSVDSGDSEMAQMRSEMAMTQPQELLPMEGEARFADTIELVSVLGPVVEPPLPEMRTTDEAPVESIVTEVISQELSPMITPAQADVVEISDSPVKDDDFVEVKKELIFTLEYMKKYSNLEEHVINEINQNPPHIAKKCMKKLDFYVEKYYEYRKSILLENKLPEELRLLTRKERREREAKAAAITSDINLSGQPSTSAPTASAPPIQMEISPHMETPSVPRVARKSRLIVYDEDEEEQPSEPPAKTPEDELHPNFPEDTLPMPHSEDFLPSVFSTQLPGDCGVPPRRQDTPFQSPVKEVTPPITPASSSRGPTPSFASHSPNTTIKVNKNAKPPSQAPAIKCELNSTSYEGEVEFVELSDKPIEINDSMDATSQNIPELLGRQPSCQVALPDNLRGLVSTLFRENHDATLSQGSRASSGSAGRSSQNTANSTAPSMGFHQSADPTENTE